MKFFRRALFFLLGIIVLFVLVAAIYRFVLPSRSFPQTSGEIQLTGLDGPVEIYRDSFGIPHIYAASEHDLFFAQGYTHAQDRFWQMDFWRHQGAGRLSELLGGNLLETDKFLRTLGWERVTQEELAQLDDESRQILNSYAEGVNAYLTDHLGTALSLEYAVLPLLNRGYEPKPWTPLNSMTWAKAMAWDLSGNMGTEIDRAMLLKTLSPEQVDFLFPPYAEDRPLIVPNPIIISGTSGSPTQHTNLTDELFTKLQSLHQHVDTLNELSGGGFEGIGSNSWVVSGDLTDTGMPLLANDPHLGAQMPSIWYEVGLHCAPKTTECSYEATGFSFAGLPGIVIGHNDKIAWSMTNVGPDVMDLYIEKINPENPNQYEYEGEWRDMEIVQESIQVAGGDPVDLTVRLTHHGPIITEVFGLEEFDQEAGIEVPANYAIALRWTALEPSCVFCAVWRFNKAQSWDEFREATKGFAVPAQNLVYADVEGNIGYQTPGNIPIRTEGHDGMLPVPGWTGEYEWQGYIAWEELPFAFNPPEGYIVTANNAVVGPEYPYTISHQWAPGFRAQRIVDMLESAPGPISIEYIQDMQGDDMDLLAEVLVPILMEIPLEDEKLVEARSLFEGWHYQMHMDSAPAALFAVFWKNLVAMTYGDELPEFYQPGGGSGWREITRYLVNEPSNPWWDDRSTAQSESRDDLFQAALAAAVEELEDSLGGDPSEWAWGDLHTLTFQNAVMSNFPLISSLFNRGPFRTAGGTAIVNATGWNSQQGYQVGGLPSMRMIVNFRDLQNSLTMHPTGQSGHAYHDHYIDMADPWRTIQYHPMHWEQDAIESTAEDHLRLIP
ncbi:MAG: penicillin acylase family protein [Anaerolineales bacterium]|jgi:penicillin amidase